MGQSINIKGSFSKLALIICSTLLFCVTPFSSSSNSFVTPSITAQAEVFHWKYGKCWMFTTKVKRLVYTGKTHKYRIYRSKTDLSDSYVTYGTLIGTGISNKWVGVIVGLVGELKHPKHGIRYDVTYHHSGAGVASNVHRWH